MHIQANYSLLPHNTFKVDVKTQYYVEINRQSDILTLRTDMKLASLPWKIIGAGSNLLFTHDVEGVIIRCTYRQIKVIKEDQDEVLLSVGAGVEWHDLVEYTVDRGWWGLENLALIPGTVGAAPVQNIGAYGTEARDSITRVQTLNIYNGESTEFRNSECNFDYRTSIFKQEYVNTLLVLRVTFALKKKHAGQANLFYGPLKESLKEIPYKELTSRNVFDAIVAIREQKIPDPKRQGNAGSFFKNPIVNPEYFEELLARFPEIPSHKMLDGSFKIPAAWLIEQAGWKGKSHGNAGVSAQHALVLVNLGNAAGSEIEELSLMVKEDVNQTFGIYLEPEVIIL